MRGLPQEARESSRVGVHAEYSHRLTLRRNAHQALAVRERLVTESRLVVFVAGLVLAWVAWGIGRAGAGWVAVPASVFVVLVFVHARIERASRRAGRAVEFYEKGLARLEDRWAGKGERGLRFLETDHPYAADLDLFGAGSLFERLCTARTRAGEDTLAGWLLRPAEPETVRARQAAVAELRDRIDLREDLELLGADVRAGIDPEGLAAWGASPRVFARGATALALVAGLLTFLTVLALAAWWLADFSLTPFLLMLAVELFFMRRYQDRIHRVLMPLDRRTQELLLLGQLLGRLEREALDAPVFAGLRARLEHAGRPASRQIQDLARLLQWLDAQKNQLVMPLAAIGLWSLHMALRIDAWRGRSGPSIAAWLAAVGEFEALCALAAYSFENPADPFPEIATGAACFEAAQVGHPLIAERECVRNDVALGGSIRVLVVSGSNMSGKSTLLRTVGINTVLALAGAPVRARSLRVAPMAIGATLRIQDSLQAGRSRFFAEITRLRQLVDLSRGPWPLLFLLDEILHGTNSHDRRVGGEAVVRGLLATGAIGLVTTHDLALAEIVEQLGPQAANVHFEDHFENGTLHFDYTMRPGVVRKSNALALMRAVGLEV